MKDYAGRGSRFFYTGQAANMDSRAEMANASTVAPLQFRQENRKYGFERLSLFRIRTYFVDLGDGTKWVTQWRVCASLPFVSVDVVLPALYLRRRKDPR